MWSCIRTEEERLSNSRRNHTREFKGPAQRRHECLVERWKEIRKLHLAGARVKDIAEWVGTSQSTVYRYRELAEPPPRPSYRRRASVLDP
ncbi:MAG TPA: helix-turn-helix domain-containing protein [Rubrobacteraceae bacterium]|nr:helix-turn-helix domain-containing protein [Rubrobacteraceae bacterium]